MYGLYTCENVDFFPPHFIATVTKVLANAVRRTNLYSHNGTKIIRMAFAGPFVTVALFSLCSVLAWSVFFPVCFPP